MTGARDRLCGVGGAVRLARRIGAQDVVLTWGQHGWDAGPILTPLVRESDRVMTVSGQGRIGLGRLSLPWQGTATLGLTARHGD